MKIEDIKIGLTVKVNTPYIKSDSTGVIRGKTDTSVIVEFQNLDVLIEEHYRSALHHCDGVIKSCLGRYIDAKELEPLEFQVGDFIGTLIEFDKKMHVGQIKNININYPYAAIEFSQSLPPFHSCNGATKEGFGYFVDIKNLHLHPDQSGRKSTIVGHHHTGVASSVGVVHTGFFATSGSGVFTTSSGGIGNTTIQNTYSDIKYKDTNIPWTNIHYAPAPSIYLHKEPSYAGVSQQFNAIIHNQQIDEFLLLN